MNNKLIKLFTDNKEIRLYIVDATNIIDRNMINCIRNEAVKHLYQKLMINCSLMRGLLTEPDQRLTVSIRFNPDGCAFYCYIDGNGNINSMLSPELCEYRKEVNELVGKGAMLSVTRGSWTSGMFTGTVELNNPSVDDFFSYFYSKSEQTETIFKTWVTNDHLRGCMVQPLPFADDTNIADVMKCIDDNEKNIIVGSWGDIPDTVFPNAKVVETYTLQLECNCSKEMFFGLLMSVDSEELKRSLQNNQCEELECGICGKKYHFNSDDLKNILTIKEKQ